MDVSARDHIRVFGQEEEGEERAQTGQLQVRPRDGPRESNLRGGERAKPKGQFTGV